MLSIVIDCYQHLCIIVDVCGYFLNVIHGYGWLVIVNDCYPLLL